MLAIEDERELIKTLSALKVTPIENHTHIEEFRSNLKEMFGQGKEPFERPCYRRNAS